MKKLIAPLLAAGLVSPLAIGAQNSQDLNYNFAQGGIAFYPGFKGQDLLGIDAKGSVAINNSLFAFGGLKYLSDNVDLTAADIGAGYHYPVMRGTDVYGGVSLEYQKRESRLVDPISLDTKITVSDSNTNVGVRAGVRHHLSDTVEVGGEARYVFGKLDYFGLTGSAQYFLTDQVGLVGEIDLYDGELGVIGSARYNF
ncbi:MAG: porin family protein [Chromatiales bacterium]|jgi:hypothetical protein|nr:porin family protein [Chromatiales bacterium]